MNDSIRKCLCKEVEFFLNDIAINIYRSFLDFSFCIGLKKIRITKVFREKGKVYGFDREKYHMMYLLEKMK
jgi:hypothetical protein